MAHHVWLVAFIGLTAQLSLPALSSGELEQTALIAWGVWR